MSRRAIAWLAWSLAALCVAMFAAIIALYAFSDPRRKYRAA